MTTTLEQPTEIDPDTGLPVGAPAIMPDATDIINLTKVTASEVFAKNGGDIILVAAKVHVGTAVYDVSTQEGRDACKKAAARVGSLKAGIEKIGLDYAREIKELPRIVDAERKRIKDYLQELQDTTRAPLTQFEQAEKARVDGHKALIESIGMQGEVTLDEPTESIKIRIANLGAIGEGRDFEEFTEHATTVRLLAYEKVSAALEASEKRDAQVAEMERLREANAALEQAHRDERIRQEATEREREASAKAVRDAEANAAATIERERQQREQEMARIAKESADREADAAHRTKICKEARAAMVSGGMDEESATLAIKLIVNGKVPNVKVVF